MFLSLMIFEGFPWYDTEASQPHRQRIRSVPCKQRTTPISTSFSFCQANKSIIWKRCLYVGL